MSDFQRAREEFRRRWGFDPGPVIESAIRNGDISLEGGTEDERAFIREVLAGKAAAAGEQSTDDTPIGLNCPGCGEPPRMVISGQQAFCGTDGCRFLTWDPTQTRAEMAAEGIREINLGGFGQ